MKVAALIVGIDGWERYTAPLLASLAQHEPGCQVVVVDNGSQPPYPAWPEVTRIARACYAAAINHAARQASEADWYVVLSNDVLCTGPFTAELARAAELEIVGPQAEYVYGQWPYLMGWCVACPRGLWERLGGWDEDFVVSSWEDVAFSTAVIQAGGRLLEEPALGFVHRDQRQRFGMPEFAGTHERNKRLFFQKYLGRSAP